MATAVPIIGAWKLISFQIERSDGTVIYPFGEDAIGSIIYSESGRFSAQAMRRARPQFAAGDRMQGTPEEIKASYEGVVSYFGPYDFDPDAGTVTHNVEGSLFPNWEGQAQLRYFQLDGNRIRLSTPPMKWSGGEIVASLVWERT